MALDRWWKLPVQPFFQELWYWGHICVWGEESLPSRCDLSARYGGACTGSWQEDVLIDCEMLRLLRWLRFGLLRFHATTSKYLRRWRWRKITGWTSMASLLSNVLILSFTVWLTCPAEKSTSFFKPSLTDQLNLFTFQACMSKLWAELCAAPTTIPFAHCQATPRPLRQQLW